MRAIVQRVTQASVMVDDELVSQIARGFMVLVGVGQGDTAQDVDSLVKKILTLRAFPDPTTGAQWKRNIKDISGEILSVSQFTLFAKTPRGRPDFHASAPTDTGRLLYQTFLEKLKLGYTEDRVKDGRFAAMMQVALVNDGPVTFTLDTQELVASQATGSRDS
ncbi:D-tyrosyl-tRNA deacylase [Auriculariales sp. MPI-PUGE-AT-0066]|nr:D-tyrosyl-tRNA deacylase [Auriculariales sp. MPI-PUGE-AT-0066]